MPPYGPLKAVHVVELAGVAPGPFTSLLLADYGASVIRIDRPYPQAHKSSPPPPTADLLTRDKSSIALNLKSAGAVSFLKSLLGYADVFIDPYRPGVLESLELDPNSLLAVNPRLIIARLTGFRRDGKYASMAGHDINYLAVSGVLSQLGRKDGPPYAPANILADFAAGGLMCAFGILTALFSRQQTGRGQIVEANMVDGSAYLGTFMRYALQTPTWNRPRGENLLDGGCPWYDVYECKDGSYIAVGALEPQFFKVLVHGLGLSQDILSKREDRKNWPQIRTLFVSTFLSKSRAEWESIFDQTDACCTPVLTQTELEQANYDQRNAVGLSETPGKNLDQKGGWTSCGLPPGVGGETILQEWTGWKRDKDYTVEAGGLVKPNKAKL